MTVWHISVTIHIVAAMVWIGGMLQIALVGAPVLRRLEDRALRAELFAAVGLRFRRIGWASIVALVATGIFNLHARGALAPDVLGSSVFWSTPFGQALAWKLGLVVAMISLAGAHDFWLGPSASTARDPIVADRMRRAAAWLARVNAGLALALVWVSVRLVRGG